MPQADRMSKPRVRFQYTGGEGAGKNGWLFPSAIVNLTWKFLDTQCLGDSHG